MKKMLSILLALTLVLSCGLGLAEDYKKPKYISMGTASVGGGYYTVGLAMCEVLNKHFGVSATAQVTGGTVENNVLIQDTEVDIALSQASMAYNAVNGNAPYEYALDNVAGMMGAITNGVFQIVTLEGSGIECIADLKGKNVAMGPAGGGTLNVCNDVWSALYGFTVDDVNATYSSYTDAAASLGDGKVDAVVWQTSAPASGVMELVASRGDQVRFVSMTDDEIAKVLEAYPYYSRFELTADTYGTPAGATTICLNNIMVCRKDLAEGLVYDMVKVLVENFPEVVAAYPPTALFKVETAADVPLELHPGAARYYREIGLID